MPISDVEEDSLSRGVGKPHGVRSLWLWLGIIECLTSRRNLKADHASLRKVVTGVDSNTFAR